MSTTSAAPPANRLPPERPPTVQTVVYRVLLVFQMLASVAAGVLFVMEYVDEVTHGEPGSWPLLVVAAAAPVLLVLLVLMWRERRWAAGTYLALNTVGVLAALVLGSFPLQAIVSLLVLGGLVSARWQWMR